ncbi:putative DNA binding domain-containing protein [Micromonospora sp. WMMD1102]|uniref:RNA-binding domain-containing protein n=1 Tax=Micromonospora sp. WMMD1102 TaxID=3016105 RepID=UPI0024159446|nr:RNA-binding domain-containing protein [Micromonospora sp. WMMD1102]MDG4785000.1 putative DNA binding domain-containing protein [Micromonospora sp. WMMD1102]
MDTSKRPVRPAEWAAVLDAVYHAEPADEQTWLEWKSTLNLRTKEHIAAVVAKAIIAFANRDPIEAATHVDGIGILIIGLEPGNVPGVVQIDNADLDTALTSYLGTDGPVWQPHWTQYQGQPILIIEVAAPAFGDPPHAFRKEYDKIRDGDVYVRHRARSVPANHREVRRLADRYANRPVNNTLDITVDVDYRTPLSRYCGHEDLDIFIEAERDRLLEPLKQLDTTSHTTTGLGGLPITTIGLIREDRSPQQYKDEVEQYLDKVRLAWPEIVRSLAAYLLPPTVFTVTNRSERNYHRLEVRLHITGDADAVEWEDGLSELDLWDLLPDQPREWGPRNSVLGAYHPPTIPLPRTAGPTTAVQRGGSLTLIIRPLDLRPGRTEILEQEYVLLIPASRTDDIVVSWSATATNINATAHGQLTLAIEGPDTNILQAWAQTYSERALEA